MQCCVFLPYVTLALVLHVKHSLLWKFLAVSDMADNRICHDVHVHVSGVHCPTSRLLREITTKSAISDRRHKTTETKRAKAVRMTKTERSSTTLDNKGEKFVRITENHPRELLCGGFGVCRLVYRETPFSRIFKTGHPRNGYEYPY